MFYNKNKHNNIVVHQINNDEQTINEVIPIIKNKGVTSLCLNDGSLYWDNIIQDISSKGSGLNIINEIIDNKVYLKSLKGSHLINVKDDENGNIVIDCSLNSNIIENNKFKDFEIYYKDGRIGIGREPMYGYILDIAIPENKVMTGLHFGTGSNGISFGNGSGEGFIPELLGIGKDEDDCGLYLLGVSKHDTTNIPLVIIDGRTTKGALKTRPILGITSSSYTDYKVLVDSNGNINATDFKIFNYGSLLDKIKELEEELKIIKDKLKI